MQRVISNNMVIGHIIIQIPEGGGEKYNLEISRFDLFIEGVPKLIKHSDKNQDTIFTFFPSKRSLTVC